VALHAEPGDIAAVYPLKGRLIGRGVGFRTVTGNDFYFWTFEGAKVRAALRGRGFPVEEAPERARKIWTGEP
jgi:hypothetical protein